MQASRTLVFWTPLVIVMVSPSPTESTVDACDGATQMKAMLNSGNKNFFAVQKNTFFISRGILLGLLLDLPP